MEGGWKTQMQQNEEEEEEEEEEGGKWHSVETVLLVSLPVPFGKALKILGIAPRLIVIVELLIILLIELVEYVA